MKPLHTPTPISLSRRRFLLSTLAVSTVPLVAGCGSPSSVSAPDTEPEIAIETSVRLTTLDAGLTGIEDRHAVRLGVLAQDPATGRTYTHRGDERFAMCSTFKTYAAAALLRLEVQGGLSLTESVAVDPADLVENSPVTTEQAGRAMTLAQLCEAALTRSDNTAGNLLLRRLGGPDAVTAFARTVGDTATRLDRWEPELNDADRGDLRDTTTATGLARGYREVLLGAGLPASQRAVLSGWMRASVTSDTRIRAGLPPGWTAADKSGAGRFGTVNDAGVVWSPAGSPLVVVILSDSTTGQVDVQNTNVPLAEATALIVRAMEAVP